MEDSNEVVLEKYNLKSWFKSSVLGFFIGLAIIVPGISGSTIAILFKLYNKLIYALGDLVCAGFSLALSCYSYPLIVANIHTMSPAMKISLSFNYIVFCVATILICIFYLIRAKADFAEMMAVGKEDK